MKAMQHNHSHPIINVVLVNLGAISLASVNTLLGTISIICSIGYSLFKLYREYKQHTKENQDS